MDVKKDNSLAWGITLLIFGIIFLFKQLDFIHDETLSRIIFDFKNYPLIIGCVFLLFHTNRNVGFAFIVLGIILRLSDIIHITRNFSDYIWPMLLIVAGGVLIARRKK